MLIDAATLSRIASGEVTAALRRWRRPTVKAGGTLKTRIGVLAIDAVDPIDVITPADAAAAGFPDVAAAEAAVSGREGALIRVRFHLAGPDPRIDLRADVPDAVGLAALAGRLATRDRGEPWTRATLDAIAAYPGRSARDIAPELGFVRKPWKVKVRSLKALGLTISQTVGYRLSERGEAVWRWLRAHTPGLHVRPEAAADADAVRRLHEAAFGRPDEARIVAALRAAGAVTLGLVAEQAGEVIGHVAFSPVTIDGAAVGVGLAPLAVAPAHQRGGVGTALVREGLTRVGRLGHPRAVVLGEPAYYTRFGFSDAAAHGLRWEHPAPPGAFQVVTLRHDAAPVTGTVAYRPEVG